MNDTYVVRSDMDVSPGTWRFSVSKSDMDVSQNDIRVSAGCSVVRLLVVV